MRVYKSSPAKLKAAEQYRKDKPEVLRRSNLGKYGLTPDQHDAMFATQKGLCALCGQPERNTDYRSKLIQKLAVDHDRQTGKVRALLCGNCNTGLGKFKHDVALFLAAIAYLREHSK